MSEKTMTAHGVFASGFNCAQSVLSVFAADFSLKTEDAFRVAGPFGAGMGCMGNVCGAVTGAFMAIGLKHAKVKEGDDAAKLEGYRLVNEFTQKFTALHGTIECRQLLNVDLNTEAGMAKAKAENLFQTHCARYVNDAVQLLEEML